MDNPGRNIAVRSYLEQASGILEMVDVVLELCVVSKLAPDLVKYFNLGDEPTVSFGMGIRTRNCWTTYHGDHLVVKVHGEDEVKIPYIAIYMLVTDGERAQDLNWPRIKDDKGDIAFVNLVHPIHDMPKYLQ